MDILHVHASCHNVGDMVLVRQLREGLRKRVPDIELTSMTHRETGAFPGSAYLSLPDLLRGNIPANRLKRFQGVVIGGGDLITGREAFRLLRTLTGAGLPVFYVGIGVNLANVSPILHRPLLRGLDSAALIWTREPASASVLSNSRVRQVETAVDLSVIAFDAEAYRRRTLTPPPDRPRIGINLRSPEGNTARWGPESYRHWAAHFDRWVESKRATLSFLSLTQSSGTERGGNSDFTALQTVRQSMRRGAEVEIIEVPLEPGAWRAELEAFDLVLGMRLHALALSTLAGIPVVPLAYSPKVTHWWDPIADVMDNGWRDIRPDDWSNLERLDQTVGSALNRTPEDARRVGDLMGRQKERAEEVLDALADQLLQLGPARFRQRSYAVRARAWEPARDVLERLSVRLLGGRRASGSRG